MFIKKMLVVSMILMILTIITAIFYDAGHTFLMDYQSAINISKSNVVSHKPAPLAIMGILLIFMSLWKRRKN
jgi:hypothetical protein